MERAVGSRPMNHQTQREPGEAAPGTAAEATSGPSEAPVQASLRRMSYADAVVHLSPVGGASSGGDPGSVAQSGFAGGGSAVPYKAEMEQTFGTRFDAVQAYSGSAATAACEGLGAEAYAVGSQVAFKGTPDKGTVAHELTHVVQADKAGGSAAPACAGGGVSSPSSAAEQEASAVESAVRSGQPIPEITAAPSPAVQLKRVDETGCLYDQEGYEQDTAPPIEVDEHPESPDFNLSNKRFKRHRKLKKIARGEDIVEAGETPSGGWVKAIQRALRDMGFDLVIHDADSHWGGETEGGLKQFQSSAGLKQTGDLNALSMQRLDAAAPAKGEQIERYFDYDQLLSDGILDFTIGIGFDEGTAAQREQDLLVEELPGFLGLEAASKSDVDAMYAEQGQKAPDYKCENYWAKRNGITAAGHTAHIVVRLFSAAQNDNAKDDFVDSMANSDVSLYGGHGRYGSGPDFDRNYTLQKNVGEGEDGETEWVEIDKHTLKKMCGGDLEKLEALIEAGKVRVLLSNEGNIHLNSEDKLKKFGSEFMQWSLAQGGEEGKAQGIDPKSFEDRYKVWFFNGCTTKYYLPPVRAEGLSTANTDMFGTGDTITKLSDGLLIFMKGIIEKQSVQDIVKELNKSYKERGKSGFRGSGMGDNPTSAD